MTATLRPATTDDIPAIEALAVAAGMFSADEAPFLGAQFRAAGPERDWWVLASHEGDLLGSVYCAPEPFSDRMWNLYFIAVAPGQQGHGYGRRMMAHVETTLRARGESVARTLIVDTSSTAAYDGARAFYARLGYVEEARLRQFYGPEDDKVTFWKQL